MRRWIVKLISAVANMLVIDRNDIISSFRKATEKSSLETLS